jgi:epoxide hydrolase 4
MLAAVSMLDANGLRDGYADLSEVRLHYVEAGEGPLVLLLHGFPEFWFSWRCQISSLAGAGFRVVAPDMRGYNLSSRPSGVAAYDVARLAVDVRDLIHERGAQSACVAGHDWGAGVAWVTAMNHPEAVERLAILNAPHPRRFLHGLRHPRQLLKSWYMFFFQLPWLPERCVRARRWWLFRFGFRHDARRGAFTAEDIDRYIEAWSQPGAVTATINYYRAIFRQSPRRTETRIRLVEAPTLVIWGERDRYLGPDLAEPDRADVPNLERVVRLPHASHWVHHDEPGRVTQLLGEFFAAAGGARTPQVHAAGRDENVGPAAQL